MCRGIAQSFFPTINRASLLPSTHHLIAPSFSLNRSSIQKSTVLRSRFIVRNFQFIPNKIINNYNYEQQHRILKSKIVSRGKITNIFYFPIKKKFSSDIFYSLHFDERATRETRRWNHRARNTYTRSFRAEGGLKTDLRRWQGSIRRRR